MLGCRCGLKRKWPHSRAIFLESKGSRSVATSLTPDHDFVAAPFADGHIATVVSASIPPITAVTISPIVVVPIEIAAFTLAVNSFAAVGANTEFELSERGGRFGNTSVFGECRKSPHCARDGGYER
jgi:hypothetical protein